MNVLGKEKQVAAIAALAEGSSIRSVERMTGVHRDTIMRLGVRVGKACVRLMDDSMRGLDCQRIQIDELWGYIGKKNKNRRPDDPKELGDVWTFIALDPVTKIIPCFRVGKRDAVNAFAFIDDLANRMKNRIQLSADAFAGYADAIDTVFTFDGVDFAQVVKTYSAPEKQTPASIRYSPGDIVKVSKNVVFGNPDQDHISTSIVERMNLNLRMHCRRLTRLTNAFSRKLENFKAAIALTIAYYTFVKRHTTLRMTPAMAAGVARDFWTVEDLVSIA